MSTQSVLLFVRDSCCFGLTWPSTLDDDNLAFPNPPFGFYMPHFLIDLYAYLSFITSTLYLMACSQSISLSVFLVSCISILVSQSPMKHSSDVSAGCSIDWHGRQKHRSLYIRDACNSTERIYTKLWGNPRKDKHLGERTGHDKENNTGKETRTKGKKKKVNKQASTHDECTERP